MTPPELLGLVEGPDPLPPGRALDLGCGTGTNAVYLARHGWEVTGVDLVAWAIRRARRRAAEAGVRVRFITGDVARLDRLGVGDGYTLIFDLGCFHTLDDRRRSAYLAGATRVAAPGACLLLYGFDAQRTAGPRGARGLAAGEVERRFAAGWRLEWTERGRDGFSAWYRLTRLEETAVSPADPGR